MKKCIGTVGRVLPLIFLFSLLFGGMTQAAAPMPHFALPSAIDGKIVDSNMYKGKALIINFFATWCPPCRKEIPSLIKLQKEYGPRGFSVIGMSTDQGGTRVVNKFIKKMKMNYPVLMSDTQTPRNFGSIMGIPTSFLVGPDGNVLKRYDGYVGHDTLKRDLENIFR